MSWMPRIFRPHVELSEALAARVRAWRALPSNEDTMSIGEARFVVVDVETTGFNVRRDRLLSIGVTTVERARIAPGRGYHALLRTEAGAKENILIHGITPGEQRAGVPPEDAMIAFLEHARRDILVACHAAFDQTILDRAAREFLGVRLFNPWIDLMHLAPALFPQARLHHAGLDDWMRYFGLRATQRHHAAHDAFVSAELLLILLARASSLGLTTVSALRAACEQQARLLPGGGAGGM